MIDAHEARVDANRNDLGDRRTRQAIAGNHQRVHHEEAADRREQRSAPATVPDHEGDRREGGRQRKGGAHDRGESGTRQDRDREGRDRHRVTASG